MVFHIFGDGTCAGIQVVLRRDARPKAYRWTLQLVRREGMLASIPDLVRISFRLPDRVHLEPEPSMHTFFVQHAPELEHRALAVLPADTFSDAGAVIEIFLRDLSFSPGPNSGILETEGISFRLNKVIDHPINEEIPLVIEAMQVFGTGGSRSEELSV